MIALMMYRSYKIKFNTFLLHSSLLHLSVLPIFSSVMVRSLRGSRGLRRRSLWPKRRRLLLRLHPVWGSSTSRLIHVLSKLVWSLVPRFPFLSCALLVQMIEGAPAFHPKSPEDAAKMIRLEGLRPSFKPKSKSCPPHLKEWDPFPRP